MRIIAGIYGGRKLIVPKNNDIRPTSDKVRGAIFNTLGGLMDFNGVRVLDAFCGTGALGLEALSRGASHCLFVDKSRQSLDLAKGNCRALNAQDSSDFSCGDAGRVQLGSKGAYDLVFLDPPYKQGLVVSVLTRMTREGVVASGAICVLETEKAYAFEGFVGFQLLKDKVYGDTRVTYLRYSKSVP